MKKFAIIITAALITLTGCAQNKKEMKTLVAYFSVTGNTEADKYDVIYLGFPIWCHKRLY